MPGVHRTRFAACFGCSGCAACAAPPSAEGEELLQSQRAEGAARMRRAELATWCAHCNLQIEPGTEIYPVEGKTGRRSSLSWLHIDCAKDLGEGQLPPVPPCKHFVRSGCCHYGDSCFFAHPQEAGVAAAERLEKRRQKPNAKVANRGDGKRNRVKNYSKVSVLRRWILDTFGVDALREGSGVLDVAGGKGELAWELINLNLVPAAVIEPRLPELKSVERKWRCGLFWRNPIFRSHLHCVMDSSVPPQVPPHLRLLLTAGVVRWLAEGRCPYGRSYGEEAFEDACRRASDLRWTRKGLREHEDGEEEDADLEEPLDGPEDTAEQEDHDESVPVASAVLDAVRHCSAVVALHPDQAAEFAIQLALLLNKPFAVVPCCVYSAEFPKRKLGRTGRPVRNYDELLEYLQQLDPRIQRTDLDFEGKCTLLYMTAADAARAEPSAELLQAVFGSRELHAESDPEDSPETAALAT